MHEAGDGVPQLPPGPGGTGVVNFLRTWANFKRFSEALHRKYGDIFYYRTPTQLNFCVVYDLDLVQEVFTAKIPDPDDPDGPPVQAFTKWQVTGRSVFTEDPQTGMNATDDAKHERAVRLTLEAFTGSRFLEAHSARIIETVQAVHEKWQPGRRVKVMPDLHEYMASWLTQVMLGTEIDAIRPRAVLDAMTGFKWDAALEKVPGSAPIRKFLEVRFKRSLDEFNTVIYDVIDKARRSVHDPFCVVSYMVDANRKEVETEGPTMLCSDVELRSSLYQEIAASIDPPTSAIVHAFGEVAWRPEVRKQLEREVDEVLGGRELTPADYDRLPYTRAILQESLRIEPPAFSPPRTAREDYVLGGYLVPRGTLVKPILDVCHRDPKYWDDPEAFRPERWLERPPRECPEHAYMPFGYEGTKRTCAGRELYLRAGVYLLAGTAQRRRLDLVRNGPLKVTTNPFTLVTPKGSVPMVVTERVPSSGRAGEP